MHGIHNETVFSQEHTASSAEFSEQYAVQELANETRQRNNLWEELVSVKKSEQYYFWHFLFKAIALIFRFSFLWVLMANALMNIHGFQIAQFSCYQLMIDWFFYACIAMIKQAKEKTQNEKIRLLLICVNPRCERCPCKALLRIEKAGRATLTRILTCSPAYNTRTATT